MTKVLMILFAFGLLLSCMIVGSAVAKDATGYSLTCAEAERYITRSNLTLKQSATDPAVWDINDKSWYGMSDDVKRFELANIFTYVKCTSKNNEPSAITLICARSIVAKTDYTGRPFLLRVMP